MPFIDIHTHNAAVERDVIKIVNHFPNSQLLFDNQNYASVGLHPWHIKNDFNEQLVVLEKIVTDNNIVAIGEAGLDKAIDTDIELQSAVFMAQASIADEHEKPMIIHSVKTYYDLIAFRKFYSNSPPWIIHGFTGNITIAKELMKNIFYLSFGKDLFNEQSHAPKTLSAIPIQNVFLETDNSEMDIKQIYQKAAELLNISVEELCNKINNNFHKVFSVL